MEVKTLSVPAGGGPLGARWGKGQELMFFNAGGERRQASDDLVRPADNSVAFSVYRWDLYQLGSMQMLLSAWQRIFSTIQLEAQSTAGGMAWRERLLFHSKAYRAELEAMLHATRRQQQQQQQQQQQGADAAEQKARYRLVQEAIMPTWHLMEVFMVDPFENATSQLMDWLQRKSPVPPRGGDGSTCDWRTVHRLALQGRVEEAARRVQADRSLFGYEELQNDLATLLRENPAVQAARGGADDAPRRVLEDFMSRWTDWQRRGRELLQQGGGGGVNAHPQARELLELMFGEGKDALVGAAHTWDELLVGQLLYRRPQTMKADVPWLVEACITDCARPLTARDELFKTIVFGDLPTALRLCSQNIDERWFVAHLADLLAHAGHLQPAASPHSKSAPEDGWREHYLLSYGSVLATHPSLWQLAPPYLASCPRRGKAHLRMLVDLRPLDSDVAATKLAALCERHGLPAARVSVLTQMGTRALRAGMYGSAVHWFAQAGDRERLGGVCDLLLDRHTAQAQATGKRDLTELEAVVDNAGTRAALALGVPEVQFVTKYRDMCVIKDEIAAMDKVARVRWQRRAQASAGGNSNNNNNIHNDNNNNNNNSSSNRNDGGEAMELSPEEQELEAHWASKSPAEWRVGMWSLLRDAVAIVVRTLCFGVAPKRMWAWMLLEAVPLLQRAAQGDVATPILAADDTYRLMACLEEVMQAQRAGNVRLERLRQQAGERLGVPTAEVQGMSQQDLEKMCRERKLPVELLGAESSAPPAPLPPTSLLLTPAFAQDAAPEAEAKQGLEQRLQLVRLALTTNLARAFMHQA